MLKVVLYEPEIPPNTGNIIRLCANTGCELHLIEPLGFELDHKRLRRAGLDYSEYARICSHQSLDDFRAEHGEGRIFAATTRATTGYHEVAFEPGDAVMFGPETRGLPEHVLASLDSRQHIRLPMRRESRSLNLSNATAVIVYEALRQQGFPELT